MSIVSAPVVLSDASRFVNKKAPVEKSRIWTRVSPNNATVFQPDNNNSMVFKFPATHWMDGREVMFSFRHKCTVPTGTTSFNDFRNYGHPRLQQLATSWIRRITIRNLADGSIVEEIDNYNVIHRGMVEAFASDEHRKNYLNVVAGYVDDKNTWNQTVESEGVREKNSRQGYQYTFALSLSGLLSSTKYWPLKWTQGLEVEIYLDSFTNSHQVGYATGTEPVGWQQSGASYQVDNAYFYVPIVEMAPEYDAKVSQAMAEGKFKWEFESFDKSTTDIVQATEYRYQLAFNARYIKSIFGVMRLNSVLNDRKADKTGTFSVNNFSSFQFDIGGINMPQFAVDSTTLAYQLLYSSMNLYHNASMGGLSLDRYTNDKFIFAMDFETSMLNSDVISGIDALANRVNLVLRHSDTPAPARLDVFCLSDKCILIGVDGSTTKLY